MTDFLSFTIYAPLASWGDTTVGEVRSSWDRPSRSALLGLLGAALGLRREDVGAHTNLDATVGLAVRTLLRGQGFIDYHTAQDPTDVSVRARRPGSRRAALDVPERERATTLSQRALIQHALYCVALWKRDGTSTFPLVAIESALRAPVFPLYAGRKANVLGLPVNPVMHRDGSLSAALSVPPLPAAIVEACPTAGWDREVAIDDDSAIANVADWPSYRIVRRRDAHPQRIQWQFAERAVREAKLPAGVP